MSYLLDTNILSAHLRRPAGLTHRFIQHSGRLYSSTICLGELYVWAHRPQDPTERLAAIAHMLHYEVSLIDFDSQCAELFGRTRGYLRRQGVDVGTVDLMIATPALVHDLTLVTHNTKDFENIPGLRLEDWLES
jgi:tRNA(fMet)-specific endonuclease VapC